MIGLGTIHGLLHTDGLCSDMIDGDIITGTITTDGITHTMEILITGITDLIIIEEQTLYMLTVEEVQIM